MLHWGSYSDDYIGDQSNYVESRRTLVLQVRWLFTDGLARHVIMGPREQVSKASLQGDTENVIDAEFSLKIGRFHNP